MRHPLPVKCIPRYRLPILETIIKVAAPHTSPERMQLLEKELFTKLKDTTSIEDWPTVALKEGRYSNQELDRVGERFMGGGLVKIL